VLSRILALPDDVVESTLESVLSRFSTRHRDLSSILRAHYDRVAHRVPAGPPPSVARQLLIGACFTNEYSVEAAALFNPSVVPHPDQSGVEAGSVRFVLSLRAVGEGHISSVEFRTGVAGSDGSLRIDDPGTFLDAGRPLPTTYDRNLFRGKLIEAGADHESLSYLLGKLPPRFDESQLDTAFAALGGQRVTRHGGVRTDELAREVAACNYEVEFASEVPLSERILWPHAPSESRGIEDARFVRFTDDDGTVTYFATYTAFNGDQVAPQLIETTDFQHFTMSQVAGPAARDKGMAIFPRRVGGSFVALSRWDRESSAIMASPDGRIWGVPSSLQTPEQPWELIQLGNCGSPVETEAGWLVLTHGVGPMREYCLGVLLLDLESPAKVIAALREPLLRPAAAERDGYVPNVVYSCGAMVVGDQLLLPYGASDSSVRFAFVDLPALLDRLTSDGPPAATRSNSAS
jgi:predicted GH43/DUF377 family glycosyl hydrolase